MNRGFEERRRSPRLELTPGPEVVVSRRVAVRLVDLSAEGALVAAEEPLPVGTIGQLRLALGAQAFSASVAIEREQPGPGRTVLLGAAILSVDGPSRSALEGFLRRAQQ